MVGSMEFRSYQNISRGPGHAIYCVFGHRRCILGDLTYWSKVGVKLERDNKDGGSLAQSRSKYQVRVLDAVVLQCDSI